MTAPPHKTDAAIVDRLVGWSEAYRPRHAADTLPTGIAASTLLAHHGRAVSRSGGQHRYAEGDIGSFAGHLDDRPTDELPAVQPDRDPLPSRGLLALVAVATTFVVLAAIYGSEVSLLWTP